MRSEVKNADAHGPALPTIQN